MGAAQVGTEYFNALGLLHFALSCTLASSVVVLGWLAAETLIGNQGEIFGLRWWTCRVLQVLVCACLLIAGTCTGFLVALPIIGDPATEQSRDVHAGFYAFWCLFTLVSGGQFMLFLWMLRDADWS